MNSTNYMPYSQKNGSTQKSICTYLNYINKPMNTILTMPESIVKDFFVISNTLLKNGVSSIQLSCGVYGVSSYAKQYICT